MVRMSLINVGQFRIEPVLKETQPSYHHIEEPVLAQASQSGIPISRFFPDLPFIVIFLNALDLTPEIAVDLFWGDKNRYQTDALVSGSHIGCA